MTKEYLSSILIGVLLISSIPLAGQLQEVINWDDPIMLNQDYNGSNPTILIDDDGCLHIFWGEYPADTEDGLIYYERVEDGIHSQASDIILTSGITGISIDAALDRDGWIHLVLDSDAIYHAKVRIEDAAIARMWTVPKAISMGPASSPSIALDQKGILYVVYIDHAESPYVRFSSSTDGGETWSQPTRISEPDNGARAIDADFLISGDGVFHVVWSETIDDFPPSGVYYSQKIKNSNKWTSPKVIAEGGYKWISIGEDLESNLHLFWTGTGNWAGKYHTYSTEGGTSWSSAEQLWPGTAGFLGFADFELDARGNLHMVTAVNSQTLFDVQSPGEIFHTIWLGDTWSEPDHLTESMIRTEYENQSPDMAISEDGQIHVVWHTIDHSSERTYVWYSTTGPNISETGGDVAPTNNSTKENLLPTPTIKPPTPTMQVLKESPTPSTKPAQISLEEIANTDIELPNPGWPIGTGVSLMVFFLISVVLFVRFRRR